MPDQENHRWRSRSLVGAVAFLLGTHVALAFLGVLNRSVTNDETGHITAGYSYWENGDYRLQPENGNLPQRWGALPLLALQPDLDPRLNPDDWAASRVWDIAQNFLFASGNNSDFLLLCARATMLCWSVAAGLLVFSWSRTKWGDSAGVGSLALFTFSPITLAHGPLVTSDMCAAVCLLVSLLAWWRMCLDPSPTRILLAGLAAGIAFVTKFSAVLLIPAFIGIGLIVLIRPDRTGMALRTIRLAGSSIITMLTAGFVIWGFFGFRFAAADPAVAAFDHFYLPWETVLSGDHLWANVIRFAREWTLLPEAFLYGFSFVAYFSAERGAFLAGHYSSTGWWWFFPFAFLVKSTIGELLIAIGITVTGLSVFRRVRKLDLGKIASSSLLPLAVFTLIFSAVTLTSNLNIGQRHILPLYLILFIASGALFSVRTSKSTCTFGTIAIVIGAIETLSNLPHHLAFFNRLAGGPENGWRLLVDSSLDWGQDVSALGIWIRENRQPNEQVYVSSFGTADPEYEGIEGAMLSPYFSLGKTREWFELEPGLYCISATMLQDVYGIKPGPWTSQLEKDFQQLKVAARINASDGTWDRKLPMSGFHPEHPLWLLDRLRFARLCQFLKVKKTEIVINHTQFVFRISPNELKVFLEEPYSALVSLMESAAAEK